jgi:hypothetical protein
VNFPRRVTKNVHEYAQKNA